NFAAGMSGGMAFVFDKDRSFAARCNRQMVDLEPMVDESDLWLVFAMLEDHVRNTESVLAQRILDNWELMVSRFVKVMPIEYRKVLQQKRAASRPTPTGRARILGR
ncbi:MAG: hypothetical protein KC635_11055, partial [Myxococcales bacterium]|nr:hypothetical protein [Myxococcales bacterium]